jgi:hypothetical protein
VTNSQYIDLVRQYAAVARRTDRSFADQVNHLVTLRLASIQAAPIDDATKAQQTNDARAMVMREYASADHLFAFPAVSSKK